MSRPSDSSIRRVAAACLAVAFLAAGLCGPARGQLLAEVAAAAGDSITRAFDQDTSECSFSDEPEHSFATGRDHGEAFCEAGGDEIFSHAERLECAKGGAIEAFNEAVTGARIDDFGEQAAAIRTRAAEFPAPVYVSVLLGHNDACTNVLDKTGNDCSGDRDPDNYCRTTPAAYEREFRLGLDELIQIPGARIAVLAVIRISQLCNFRDKDVCGPQRGVLECEILWQSAGFLEDVFGEGGVCASLTSDCSDQRKIDMYQTLLGYNEVLQRVTAEYAALPVGGTSPTGATRAENVALRYIDTTFFYRIQEDELSCCDCFHPSERGQRKLAQFTWEDLQCSEEVPCCEPTDDPFDGARCTGPDTTSVHPGGFWANSVICGNGVVDPGEGCDDGNMTGGDGCDATCMSEGGATPTVTPSGSPGMTPTTTPSGSPGTPGTPTTTPSGGPTPAGCSGDCGGDGTVSIDELIVAVNIALGAQPASSCTAADANANGAVTIEELVAAVNRALSGC